MKWNKKVVIAASALALLLAGSASIKPALAYLTTYTETSGGITLATRPDAEIKEDVNGLEKTIRIENTGSGDVWVRVKLYYPGDWKIGTEPAESGANINWYNADNEGKKIETGGKWSYDATTGYFNYSGKIAAGELTDALKVEISPPEGYTQDFDVIVLYEYTAETEDGKANWDAKVTDSSTEVSSEESEDSSKEGN